MKIQEAIEILNDRYAKHPNAWKSDYLNAVRLSIEALKRELNNRSGSKYVIVAPLKGETFD